MPSDKRELASQALRERYRALALRSTYFMAKTVCGFHDLDPDLHGMMANWIQQDRPRRRCLGLAPRFHLKTSLWTIADSLRIATSDPNQRILIKNEVLLNASKMVQQIRQIVEGRPMFAWLFPEVIPDFTQVRWNDQALTFKRDQAHKEATIEAVGVGGASTSNHYSVVKEDDVVGKDAAESPSMMQKAIDDHKLSEALISNPALDPIQTYGTRWHPNDVYEWMLKNQLNLDLLHLAVRRPDGVPIWPARMTEDVIQDMRRTMGPLMFALQMENRVVNTGQTELDPNWLRYWSWAGEGKMCLERPKAEGGPWVVDVATLRCTQTIDAADAEGRKNARTANVVCALVQDPRQPTRPWDCLVLEALAEQTTPPATIERAWQLFSKWHVDIAGLEVIRHLGLYYWAIQTYPEFALRKLKADLSEDSKARGIRAFCAPYGEQGRLYIHRSQVDLLEEWAAFPAPGARKDLLDALRYQPQLWTPPGYGEQIEDDDSLTDADGGTDGIEALGGSAITGY